MTLITCWESVASCADRATELFHTEETDVILSVDEALCQHSSLVDASCIHNNVTNSC